jgi:hypothetical protein
MSTWARTGAAMTCVLSDRVTFSDHASSRCSRPQRDGGDDRGAGSYSSAHVVTRAHVRFIYIIIHSTVQETAAPGAPLLVLCICLLSVTFNFYMPLALAKPATTMLLSCPPALLLRPPVSRARLSRARLSRAFPVRAPPCALVRPQPRSAFALLTRPAAFAHLPSRAVGS